MKKNYLKFSTLIYKDDPRENYLIVCKNQTCSNKIKTINMLHLANPNSGFAKSKLDYIIFTENGPLVP